MKIKSHCKFRTSEIDEFNYTDIYLYCPPQITCFKSEGVADELDVYEISFPTKIRYTEEVGIFKSWTFRILGFGFGYVKQTGY